VKDLGLGGLSGVATIKALIDPILALKKEIEGKLDATDAAECEGATAADYKVKDPDGKEITGLDIQAKLKSWLDIQTFPLSKSSKRKIKKKVKNADDESDDPIWGDIVLGYSDFYDKAIAK
jgi:hypothetical protein